MPSKCIPKALTGSRDARSVYNFGRILTDRIDSQSASLNAHKFTRRAYGPPFLLCAGVLPYVVARSVLPVIFSGYSSPWPPLDVLSILSFCESAFVKASIP
jgi:hypothetical protein